jgi:uncharacterized membrane protein YebE (DUF533 family)
MKLFKAKTVPTDRYQLPGDFDPQAALAFPRENAPPAYLAVMAELQDRIADASSLVANMATSKEAGYLAHAAGQLNALQELWEAIESKREEGMQFEMS